MAINAIQGRREVEDWLAAVARAAQGSGFVVLRASADWDALEQGTVGASGADRFVAARACVGVAVRLLCRFVLPPLPQGYALDVSADRLGGAGIDADDAPGVLDALADAPPEAFAPLAEQAMADRGLSLHGLTPRYELWQLRYVATAAGLGISFRLDMDAAHWPQPARRR